ncbi:MAG: DNA polymerase III subunit gamma/tau [Phycisphaeraceae bacterium]
MAYTVLARRYRSQSFADVVGQQPIAQTLRNAIAAGRVHHAYLFCGTRGVGKTSMARLLARALNAPATITDCPTPATKEDYPPLDVQERMAAAIMVGQDLNVIEIDGASNRGVEDARQLIANAGLAPTGNAHYKVYIIDEVHMLTKDAFNTLLKIMEEPPSHLKFILCTTEPEKVLPTIQSRCQRFDFRNIPTRQIAEHLHAVLDKEKINADDQVIHEIARQGNGSMRDALSLMDRLLATGENPLTFALLEQMLGLPDRQLVVQLADAMTGGDVAATLAKADELLRRGISQDQLILTLIDHLRQLMLLAACGDKTDLVDLDETFRKQLSEQARRFDVPALIHAMAMLENVSRWSRQSSAPRALLDAALARLAMSDSFAQIAAIATGAGVAPSGGEKKK